MVRQNPGKAAFAVSAKAATYVERKTDEVTDLYPVHRLAYFSDPSQILVPEDFTLFDIGAAFVHVQVRAANIGGGDFHEHVRWFFNFCIRNILDAHVASTIVN